VRVECGTNGTSSVIASAISISIISSLFSIFPSPGRCRSSVSDVKIQDVTAAITIFSLVEYRYVSLVCYYFILLWYVPRLHGFEVGTVPTCSLLFHYYSTNYYLLTLLLLFCVAYCCSSTFSKWKGYWYIIRSGSYFLSRRHARKSEIGRARVARAQIFLLLRVWKKKITRSLPIILKKNKWKKSPEKRSRVSVCCLHRFALCWRRNLRLLQTKFDIVSTAFIFAVFLIEFTV
jgi:hypothetical protein